MWIEDIFTAGLAFRLVWHGLPLGQVARTLEGNRVFGNCHWMIGQPTPRLHGFYSKISDFQIYRKAPRSLISRGFPTQVIDTKVGRSSVSDFSSDCTVQYWLIYFSSSLEVLPDYEGDGAFKSHAPTRPRSKLIIDATKGPSRWPSRIRDPFEHISPVGYHDIKLTDFIEE